MEYLDFMPLFCRAVQDSKIPVPSLGKTPFSWVRFPQTITNTGSVAASNTGSRGMEREEEKEEEKEGGTTSGLS